MENPVLKSAIVFLLTLVASMAAALPGFAQQKYQSHSGYDLSPAPDVWYNNIDGIRVGLRLHGKQSASFGDGAHRLDLGVWLGTSFPKYPLSYYVSYTEPIRSISDYGSEANVQLISSIRTGFQQHELAFNKRWQAGFNEKNYAHLTVDVRAEDRFASDYLQYPQIWQTNWLYLAGVKFKLHKKDFLGRYAATTANSVNLAGSADKFITSRTSLEQHIPFNKFFSLNARLFAGISSNNTAPEYLISHSFSPYREWNNNGLTRAKGTIPTLWMGEGFVQVTGGANLRGYLNQDITALNQGKAPVYTSMGALNLELNYSNPIDQAVNNIPIIGNLLKLKSYLFFDSGTSLGLTSREEKRTLSDAGLGFMIDLNIPDYFGNPRGIRLRYDIPLWLSNPSGSNPFHYRNVIGIGAIFSL